MSLIIQAFKYAAEPFFFQQAESKNSPQLFARVMHWFIIFCSVLMVGVSVNLKLIGSLFFQGEGYEMGLTMVPMLLMGYLFLGIYYNLSVWFKLTDNTQYSFYITAIGAAVTIVFILTLVPVFGFVGAAMGTFGSYFIMMVVCYLVGQRYYPIPYRMSKGITYMSIAFLLSYGGFWLDSGSIGLNFVAHNSLVLVYVVFIFLMEKKELSSLIKQRQ
jgi:O-antigen/teichoic acid export membrane protein